MLQSTDEGDCALQSSVGDNTNALAEIAKKELRKRIFTDGLSLGNKDL